MQKVATGAGGHLLFLAQFAASRWAINQGQVAAKHGCRNPAGKVFIQFHLHTQLTTWTGGSKAGLKTFLWLLSDSVQ